MSNNLLSVYTICWNEEKILPDFIKWYRDRVPGCEIVVYDNQSTDNTFQIAKDNLCKIYTFGTKDQMDEQTLINIRNGCWKESQSKWCIVVDADELVDINTELLERLYPLAGNIYRCEGYEMFGTEEDTIKTLVNGCKSAGYCKPVLFKPECFETINFAPGSHDANPIPKYNQTTVCINNEINLYHTKWRSWSNGIDRAHLLAKRRSEHSRSMNWNIHYEFDDSLHLEYYSNGIKNATKVR